MSANLQISDKVAGIKLSVVPAKEEVKTDVGVVVNTAPVVKQQRMKKVVTNKVKKAEVKKVPNVNSVNPEIVKNLEKQAVLTNKVEPVQKMDIGELSMNFVKGSLNLYSNATVKTLQPLMFLINNGGEILKGFSHLAMPLLMSYFFLHYVPAVTEMLQDNDNKMISLVYAVSFYFASSLVWLTGCIFAGGLIKTAKQGIFNIANKGKNLN